MADPASPLPSGAHILDSFTDAVYWLDRDWRFGFINTAAERVLGQPRERLRGQIIWDAFPGLIGTIVEHEYRRAVEQSTPVVFDAWPEPLAGWSEFRLYPADDGLSVSISDISDRKRAELRVATAEAHYRRLVTHTPLPVYALDRDGCFTEINPAAERLLARPAAELLGMPYERVVAPASLETARSALARVTQGLVDDVEIEIAIRQPSGDDRLVAITATAIREDDHVHGLHGVARDITEERAALTALADRQRQMQQVLDALPLGVSLVDLTGQQTWSNPALDRIWGGARPVGPDRYRAYVGWAADTSARLPDHEWPIVRALRGDTVSAERIDIQAFDGARKSTIVSAVPLRDASGALTGALAVQEDVTAAQALEARQRLLATVFDGLREGVCVLTPSGHALYANSTFADVLGLDPSIVPGLHPDDLSANSEAARQFPLMLRAALDTGRWAGRAEHQRSLDGRLVTLDIVLSLVRGTGGDDLLFGIVQDVTSEITREQHLRRTERLASIGTLVAGVAHELNNPLQAILGFAQLLRLRPGSSDDVETLAALQREAERMAKIVADLKQVARSTQEPAAARSAVDLNEVIRHVCRVQAYRLRTSNIDIVDELAGDVPPVLGDRGQLEEIVLNLLLNAVQAMEATAHGGRVTLTTAGSARGVTLTVRDEGAGIAKEHVERIFDPFFTTKAPGEGTGLGLSVVHALVTDHGGDITVESDAGLGTTVRVLLPAAGQPAMVVPEATAAVTPEPAAVRQRVLVVDDEPAIRLVLTQFLGQRGHVVQTASDGASALRLLADEPFDVVLSDLRMPGLGGEGLLQRMRELQLTGRVVFMTGDPTQAGAGRSEDGVEILSKPMRLEDVARVVEHGASR